MGMEGQGQPVAAAHGRSLSRDYRVCAVHGGLITGIRWQESVYVCVCVHDSDHRVCLCECVYAWQRKLLGLQC